jgi:hypothetical protein
MGDDDAVAHDPTLSPLPRLTLDRLNRATLARQGLLAPVDLDPVSALEVFGGLQAQEPASPYLALWTRLTPFDAAELHRAFHERRAVKTTLMRITLHAVSSRDYRRLLPALLPMLRTLRRGFADRPEAALVPELVATIATFAATPRGNPEIRQVLASRVGEQLADDVWWLVRRQSALVHVPDGVPWAFGRRPSMVHADAWLDDEGFADEAAAIQHLVRRHLTAFGPATAADIAAWAGISVAAIRPGIEAVAERRFVDERGRELLDVADAPLPDADVPAPPRLLPMWDSTLLAFADRTRIVSDADRALVIARNGDVAPTFLVDGRVAGLWWAVHEGGRTHLEIEPFRPLAVADRRALDREAERLATWLEPLEPRVYARYRASGARRRASTA